MPFLQSENMGMSEWDSDNRAETRAGDVGGTFSNWQIGIVSTWNWLDETESDVCATVIPFCLLQTLRTF